MSIPGQRAFFFVLAVVLLFVFTTITWNRNNHGAISSGTTVVKEVNISRQQENACHTHWNTTTMNHTSICFVHLGKTAGSTITCMLNRSVQQSGKGNSGCAPDDPPIATAISRHVSQRVHLDVAPALRFDSFLITLRNPMERIKSWYYYLHPDFPPAKLPRHKKGCADFAFFQCWPTLQSFASVGLNATTTKTTSNTRSSNYDAAEDECRAWAWGIATGSRHCWHNYWNYNRTYGSLLLSGTQKEIFAIRTEHTWDDWMKIDGMLSGTGKLGKLPGSKNDFRETIKSKNLTLDDGGRDNLCQALCYEIQIYKRLLQMAKNLCHEDKQQSLAELLKSCPEETEDIRECT